MAFPQGEEGHMHKVFLCIEQSPQTPRSHGKEVRENKGSQLDHLLSPPRDAHPGILSTSDEREMAPASSEGRSGDLH